MINITCPKCNNTVVVDEKVKSCFCTYCGSAMPVVANTQSANHYIGAAFLEKGLLIFEDRSISAVKPTEAKEAFISGLSFEPDNMALLFGLTLCSEISSFAEKYFKLNSKVTVDEEKIIDRLLVSNPLIIERGFLHTCFYYKQTERIKYLLKRHPEIFTQEKLLSNARREQLSSRYFVAFLLKQGIDLNTIFKARLRAGGNPFYWSTYDGVRFEEHSLPLDVFEMYLDLGLDVNYKITVKETYTKWVDGYEEVTEEVDAEMDFYSFFETFESAQIGTEKDYLGNDVIVSGKKRETGDSGRHPYGTVFYRFEYRNNTPRDYMAALIKHGYVPKPQPQPQKRKRRFPWF